MSGGGGGGNAFKPVANLFTFGQAYPDDGNQAAGGALPPQAGDLPAQRNTMRDRIKNDKTLDDIAKQDLLVQLDAENSDPLVIQQKYTDILDPESNMGRQLLVRKDQAYRKEKPGLKNQTSFDPFLGASSSPSRGSFF